MYVFKFFNNDKTKEERTSEIQSKIDAYKQAQIFQLMHGGPGPVADYEIMTVVNDHNSEFDVELPVEEVIDEVIIDE